MNRAGALIGRSHQEASWATEPRWPGGRPRLGVFSRTIASLPLSGFLDDLAPVRRLPKLLLGLPFPTAAARFAGVDAVVGWGVGRTDAELVRRFARRERVGYVALEDGFIRSVAPGGAERPASLVVDPVGIYYDATRPSLLELLLEQGGWETPELLSRAEKGVALLKRLRLSKYNAPEAVGRPPPVEGPYTLVIDQRRGDMSVALGGSQDAFPAMLQAARSEHPDAATVVKIHPDELSGRHAGHLRALAEAAGAHVLAENVDPWTLVERARTVYTVSSLMGFEALMAGRPTRCFGMPFYAGWGISHDERRCHRRMRRRSVAEIFAAAYLVYARYADVETGGAVSFEAAAASLAARRDARRRNGAPAAAASTS